jgi:hypothetical protein
MIETATYRLAVERNGAYARLSSPDGSEEWLRLSLLAAVDALDARDETLGLEEPVADGTTITVERRSTLWRRAGTRLVCRDDAVEVHTFVEGHGVLGAVHLLGGRALSPVTGFFPSGVNANELFSANPGDPRRLLLGAGESAAIGVNGDGLPGRGHWFFTPAPLVFAFRSPAGSWLGLSLPAALEELRFVQAELRGDDRAAHLVLDYEGHTGVSSRFDAPVVVLSPGVADGYDAIARYRAAVSVPARDVGSPDWWKEPIFCGWGAQCALARHRGVPASELATQESYDAFLATLAEHDVVPGTIVIDDKWQTTYGRNEPDSLKWPDLRRWIAARHEQDQHVLLWWKAWDPEGLDPELCIRTADGTSVALDPTSPAARDLLERTMTELIGPGGLDADGLKVDFTARTPSGAGLALSGDLWGISLLHELLRVVYVAVKNAKREALVITQTPHPSFVDVADMVRLNDMLRLDDPGPLPPVVAQMEHRAAIARAACPELLIDTDDWAVPNKHEWRAYLEAKPELGVPSLYYATELDVSGEQLDDDDYAALRAAWGRAR